MTALSIGVTVKNDFVSLGLTVKGAKILTMSVCPFIAAYSIGVKSDFDSFRLTISGAKILTISVCPLFASNCKPHFCN